MIRDRAAKVNESTMMPFMSLAFGILVIITILYFYWPALSVLGGQLVQNSDNAYGLIIPLISVFIIYKKWPRLRAESIQPSWLGLPVLALGLFIYMFGELYQSAFIPSFSFIVVLAGLVLLVCGWDIFRLVFFPIALLVLMIPYEGSLARITMPLQLLSSKITSEVLSFIGYTNYLQGNIIDLGVRKLNVVEACSGLRYIINLMTIAIVFCYFFQRCWWKIVIIFLSIIPYAIFGNVLRIVTIAIFPIFEQDLWHESIGLSIIILGFDYLKLVNWSLNRLSPPLNKPMLTAGREPKAGLQFRKWAPLSLYLGLAFLLMALTGPAIAKLATAPPRPLPEGFDTFPMQLGAWQGRHTPVEPRILKATGSDAYLNAVFTNPGHEAISAWIGYYEQQRQGKSPHCPYTCSTGAGWREVESKIVPITPEVSARAVLMEKGGERKLMYYWYYHSGEWIARDHFIKLAIAKNLLTQRRSNGAIILLDTRVGNNPEEAHKQMQSFAQQLIPALQKFIPE